MIAFRHLLKNKLFVGINVLSLSIGISATLVIFLMIHHDLSFDKHLPHGDRVYRVVSTGNSEWKSASVLTPLVVAIEEEITGLAAVAPIFKNYETKITINPDGKQEPTVYPKEKDFIFTNPDYFTVYPHRWLAGNASSLSEPNKMVLSKENIDKYFSGIRPEEAVGQVVRLGESVLMEVAGVVESQQANSDFKFEGFLSFATVPTNETLKTQFNWGQWNNFNDSHQCLVLLEENTLPGKIESDIALLLSRHKKAEDDHNKDRFTLQPLADVHFNADYNYAAVKASTQRNLILLALFLLALGAINFINLSTAQSIERAKEVGIRKTLGSSKATLVKQFLAETFFVTFVATLLSLVLLPILLRAFEGFVPEGMQFGNFLATEVMVFLIVQLFVVTLLAGFYPAWVMTGYSPILALKNQASKNSSLTRSALIRKALTIFQFVIAQVFLISVLLVSKQISFATNKDMGFRKEAIVNFYMPDFLNIGDKGEVLKAKLQGIPEISAVSFGSQSPAFSGSMRSTRKYDSPEFEENISFDARSGDDSYLDVYNIPLVAGRNIRLLDSTQEALVNESMLGMLKLRLPDEAIGKTFNDGNITVIGVMKDFHKASIHHDIRPTMYLGNKNGYVMHVALDKENPQSWQRALSKMEAAFNDVYPHDVFEYNFLDETVQKFYNQELKLSRLLKWAVGLSILIAGLGLFGLALFTTNRRTKEIGIRKVLGASVGQIVLLLVKGLLGLVLVACLIAFPIAWYFMHQWLADFAYKTEISWWIFVGAALGMTAVAALVLSAKSIQAANANPVESLRDE